MRFAVICSAGGSAFFTAFDILLEAEKCVKENFIIITDRSCDAELEAARRGIEYKRIPFESKQQFSISVADFLIKQEITAILMLYSRLITSDLFLAFPTLNIHPALLPAFKGMNAVGQALDAGAKFMGATLHLTTEKMDDGTILAQVVSPIKNDMTRVQADRLSFLQKTYLILVTLDAVRLKLLNFHSNLEVVNWHVEMEFTCSANPCIPSSELRNSFSKFQVSLGMSGAIK